MCVGGNGNGSGSAQAGARGAAVGDVCGWGAGRRAAGRPPLPRCPPRVTPPGYLEAPREDGEAGVEGGEGRVGNRSRSRCLRGECGRRSFAGGEGMEIGTGGVEDCGWPGNGVLLRSRKSRGAERGPRSRWGFPSTGETPRFRGPAGTRSPLRRFFLPGSGGTKLALGLCPGTAGKAFGSDLGKTDEAALPTARGCS